MAASKKEVRKKGLPQTKNEQSAGSENLACVPCFFMPGVLRSGQHGATYELAMLRIRVGHWGKALHFPLPFCSLEGRARRRGESRERKGKGGWTG